MSWPTRLDYNEVIQSPKLCFDDSELKAGEPALDTLGLPRPYCGAFATVYRLKSGQRNWAIKCFTHEFADQQQRYAAISNHLTTLKLPYIVGFEFLSKGIKVRNQWYPILKMEWVQGELIHDYIKKHLQDSTTLLNLADQWQAMIKSLQGANIGHGDLQHGNVLVVNGGLRLIDYDGMFVPALAGQISHEIGHQNYQHPLRTGFDFGPYLDHFAAWVIYVSLVALSLDNRLWHLVGAGDEFILFRKEDFVGPDSSSTFRLLAKHTDTRIQSLTTLFRSLLYLGPQQIPALDGQPALQTITTRRSLSPSIDWLADHVKLTQTKQSSISSGPSAFSSIETINIPLPSENSTWILDFISAPETARLQSFSSSVTIPRITVLASSISLLVIFTIWHFATASSAPVVLFLVIAAGLVNRRVLLQCYQKDSVVAEKEALITREDRESRLFDSLQRSIRDRQSKKKDLLAEESKKRMVLTKQMSELQGIEKTEKNGVEAQLKQKLDSINNRRLGLNREEADALRRIQETFGYEIARLNRELTSLVQAESDEMSKALQTIQNQFLKNHLSRYSITYASISGIGEKLKERLLSSGVHTAYEAEWWRVIQVEGIGHNKANAIDRWRESILINARTKMPTSLSQSDVNGIKQKYESQKLQLENQRDDIKQRLAAQERTIREQYVTKRKALNIEQLAAQTNSTQGLRSITNKYVQEYASISQKLVQLATEVKTESQKIAEDTSKLQKQMFDCHWQLAKTRRELKAFENVSFRTYLRFVLLGRHAR